MIRQSGQARVKPLRRAAAALALVGALAGLPQAHAQLEGAEAGPDPDTPALLQADEIEYRDKRQLVIARGDVEIAQGERILLADQVTYNLETDIITAEGNVALLEPKGDVVFGDKVKVTGDLREGVLQAFRMLLSDDSRLAAASAVRVGDNRTDMNKAVYSPCDLCREDPDRAPLWQLRARRVIHDQNAKTVTYRDARLEFFGLPVFYTPYFQHPGPEAERQSGLLRPRFGVSGDLGVSARLPYYFVLSDQSDFTFEPLFTSSAGQVMAGTYRRELDQGRIELTGSITQARGLDNQDTVQNGDLRGHVDMLGRFDIDEHWRWGFDVKRSSDDTYLRRYDIGHDDPLESRLFAERFSGRNYFVAQGLSYQGLRREDDAPQEPWVVPDVRYSFISDPDVLGGTAFLELGALNLMRTEGRDTRRLSSSLGWEYPYLDELGGRLTLTSVLHLDGYAYSDTADGASVIDPAPGAAESGTSGRAFPQIAISYAYPFVRHSGLGTEVLTPKVQVVAGPNGGNSKNIPNEESRVFEFEASNLFALNRFPGRDRVSSGQRIDYGLSYTYTTPNGSGTARAFVGQSFRINSNDALPGSVGGNMEFSDYVGRFELQPLPFINASYNVRVDDDELALRRSEFDMRLGPEALNLRLNYSFLDNDEQVLTDFREREQLDAQLQSRLTRYWSAYVKHSRDLQRNAALTSSLGVIYHDECFLFDVQARRRFFRDRDVEPTTSFLVTIGLKNVGQTGTGSGEMNRRN